MPNIFQYEACECGWHELQEQPPKEIEIIEITNPGVDSMYYPEYCLELALDNGQSA